MVKLENDYFTVQLGEKGAEIISLVSKKDQTNYMWKRDPRQWANSAPILFPIVGAINNNECRINGQTYSMTQHGFARHNEFNVENNTNTSVDLILKPNEEIKKQYPFNFELKISYTLIENKLSCNIEVTNKDDSVMWFQVGGHPAFACPFKEGEDVNSYYIEFEKPETVKSKLIDVANKGMSRDEYNFLENEKRFFIRQALFDNDAIVLKNLKSHYVDLKSLDNSKYLRFTFNNFNHLGIWAAKHVGDLIAIEPWVGHIDYVDFKGEFKDKEGVVELQPNNSFNCDFTVEINE